MIFWVLCLLTMSFVKVHPWRSLEVEVISEAKSTNLKACFSKAKSKADNRHGLEIFECILGCFKQFYMKKAYPYGHDIDN